MCSLSRDLLIFSKTMLVFYPCSFAFSNVDIIGIFKQLFFFIFCAFSFMTHHSAVSNVTERPYFQVPRIRGGSLKWLHFRSGIIYIKHVRCIF